MKKTKKTILQLLEDKKAFEHMELMSLIMSCGKHDPIMLSEMQQANKNSLKHNSKQIKSLLKDFEN